MAKENVNYMIEMQILTQGMAAISVSDGVVMVMPAAMLKLLQDKITENGTDRVVVFIKHAKDTKYDG